MVGRGGSRGIGLDLGVSSNTLISDLSNVAVVVVSSVLHMLDPSIGKSNRVGSKHIAIGISRLSSVEGSLGVVILDPVLVGVGHPWLSSISRLGGISRSWGRGISRGRCRDIWGRSRGICRGRGICWGRRRWRRKRSIRLGGISRSWSVRATRVGTSHSHQSGQDESLK